ncbi:MAG: hypothetical protein AB7E55_32715 [Pigmentiphaga sp.]
MRYRMFEMFSASVMFSWGAAMLAIPTAVTPNSAYRAFIEQGIPEDLIGAIMCLAGLAWLVALVINGLHRRTPLVRALGASVGCLVSTQIAWLLLSNWWQGELSIFGGLTYGLAAAYNCWAMFVSAADAVKAKRGNPLSHGH